MNKLYILCGIPFSGKSFFAKRIAEKRGFVVVDLDEVKFEIFGRGVKDSELIQKDWDLIYQKMYQRISNLLKEGRTVIHDTGNFTNYERGLVKEIADKLNIETVFVYVNTPKEVAYERLIKNRKSAGRFDVSDEDFENTTKEMEIPVGDNVLILDYKQDIDDWINKNIKE